MQQGNFIDVFLARHVSGTYAHHQELLSLLSSNSTKTADGSSPGWPVPEAVIKVVRAPDDGCQHTKHVELSTEMQ